MDVPSLTATEPGAGWINVAERMTVEVARLHLIAEHVEHRRREVGQSARFFDAGPTADVRPGNE